ncbi:MAG TPA: molybdopterin-dependent oxidoreductase [Pseudolabrys sp.]|jgi:DMSO/TMAO reductase YedYZ molybdopterin-dependent catalytic subunit|nr:molybdopterin-dependent oxidoreductase [Pseudolabrys sp.]
MKRRLAPDRRQFLRGSLVGASALALGGCDQFTDNQTFYNVLKSAEAVTRHVQRAIIGQSLAKEYTESDISTWFKPNGSTDPQDPHYKALAASNFADWQLAVDGLVKRPARLSLADLRAMPSRTQITRHDCVEGWSCIGKWKGVPLGKVLERVELDPRAKYIVFYCADTMENSLSGPIKYYESIGLDDAFHPQTILAYEMNDKPLPIPHGAPLRLRVERQLGYKMAKYVMRIAAVESFSGIADGNGGYWEDRNYEWYAGI